MVEKGIVPFATGEEDVDLKIGMLSFVFFAACTSTSNVLIVGYLFLINLTFHDQVGRSVINN